MSSANTSQPAQVAGVRKSGMDWALYSNFAGKQWKAKSAPNKNPSLRTTFSKRITKAKQIEATKALERQLNEERKVAETVIVPLREEN